MAGFRGLLQRINGTLLLRAAVLMALSFALPSMLGLAGMLVCLLGGWSIAAMLYPTWGWAALTGLAGSAIGFMRALPADLFWLPLVWMAAGLAGTLLPAKAYTERIVRWSALAVIMLLTVLTALTLRYPGETAEGIAQEMIDTIQASENRAAILASAYDAGLATLEDESLLSPFGEILPKHVALTENQLRTLLAGLSPLMNRAAIQLQLYGMMQPAAAPVIPERAANELLYSLQTTLEALLRTQMPKMAVSYVAFTTVLCALLPDEWRRRRGIGDPKDYLPNPEAWKLPKATATLAAIMYLPGLMLFLTTDRTMRYLFTLISSTAAWAFMYQGAGLLAYWLKKRPYTRAVRLGSAFAMALIFPQALEILGMLDQIFPLRKSGDEDE